jgi:hypothetical protein
MRQAEDIDAPARQQSRAQLQVALLLPRHPDDADADAGGALLEFAHRGVGQLRRRVPAAFHVAALVECDVDGMRGDCADQ